MKLQKIASLVLAIILVLSLGINAFAAGTGSITINGISDGNTYEIYKLLDLESYNTTSGAYSYKVNSAWTGFFATAEALAYVAIDGAGYVTWTAAEDDDTVAEFAKKALAYAKGHAISPVKSSDNAGEFVITTDPGTGKSNGKFTGLDLGYYLIDSTMGALCGLTTTNPDASVNAKNASPSIDKQVKEDSTSQWGSNNTAEIGQEVEFRTTINVHDGAEGFVLHDIMSAGLTFKTVSKIEHIIPDVSTTVVPTTYYTVKTTGTCTITGQPVPCTFEIEFTQEFCDHLETNDKIVVYYTATVNENAIINGDGNSNKAVLEFGEDHFTTVDETTTKTFSFDIVKTDSQNTLLSGAQFKIYDAETGGNEIPVVKISANNYRRAKAGETGEAIVVENKAEVVVSGFDNGTYYLEETVSPEGYNKLTARQKFIISDGNLDATFNDGIFSTGSGVHVVNKTGSMLPETGGIGTTLFYVVGGILVAGSIVFLVTRKRMGTR